MMASWLTLKIYRETAGCEMDKKEIRALMRARKRELTPEYVEDYSRRATEKFCTQDFYRDAQVLYAYLSFNQELRTDGLIRRAWADGKRVAVPRVLDRGRMEFYYIDSFDGFVKSSLGVPEPPEDPAKQADEPEVLLLMPGLAFDRKHDRVGYGGGYYDRYLNRYRAKGTRFVKPALAYDFQIVDFIPSGRFDVRVDAILTAEEIL